MSNEDIIKVARDSLNKSRFDSKYDIKDEKLTVETLISLPNYTKEFIDNWHRHLPVVRKGLFQVKDTIKDLVKVRNKLLRSLQVVNEFVDESSRSFTKYDFAEMAKMSTKAQSQQLFNPYDLYSLRKRFKTEEDEYEINSEYTETEKFE